MDNTSLNGSYNYSDIMFIYYNHTYDFDYDYYDKLYSAMHVATCVIIAIGLPLTLLAIYGHYSLMRKGNPAPIFIINLLISDIIQFCCMIAEEVANRKYRYAEIEIKFRQFHNYSVALSVGFMVCVALERYLLIACPLWYRFRRTIKKYVGVCVFVWICPTFYIISAYLLSTYDVVHIIFSIIVIIYLLLPLPLLIFSLLGTLRALSASISVPSDEKRRIVGTLVLVLLTYILLFLPSIILFLSRQYDMTLNHLSYMFVNLSPLADLLLYFFMKKGIIDKHLASLCCCRMESNEYVVSI